MIPQSLAAALVLGQISAPIPSSIQSPLESMIIINPYISPETKYSAGHRGIDLQGYLDAEVLSPVTGEVSFVGQVGFRNLITISFADYKISLEPVCSTLLVGDQVSKSQVIGTICEIAPEYQWHCSYCLHMGLRNQSGYLTPEMYLRDMPPSRLKP